MKGIGWRIAELWPTHIGVTSYAPCNAKTIWNQMDSCMSKTVRESLLLGSKNSHGNKYIATNYKYKYYPCKYNYTYEYYRNVLKYEYWYTSYLSLWQFLLIMSLLMILQSWCACFILICKCRSITCFCCSHFDGIRALVFHPVEPVLITASEDHMLKLWNLQKTVPAKK